MNILAVSSQAIVYIDGERATDMQVQFAELAKLWVNADHTAREIRASDPRLSFANLSAWRSTASIPNQGVTTAINDRTSDQRAIASIHKKVMKFGWAI